MFFRLFRRKECKRVMAIAVIESSESSAPFDDDHRFDNDGEKHYEDEVQLVNN